MSDRLILTIIATDEAETILASVAGSGGETRMVEWLVGLLKRAHDHRTTLLDLVER